MRSYIPLLFVFSFILISCTDKPDEIPAIFPQKNWVRESPQKLGLNEQPFKVLQEFIGGAGLIIKKGYIVWSWGDTTKKNEVASAVKPILSYFFLRALQDQRIGQPDDLVKRFEPRINEIDKTPDGKSALITWRHLLNQTSGYGITESPGTSFDYNDYQTALFWDTLVEKVYQVNPLEINEQLMRKYLGYALEWEDSPVMDKGKERLGRLMISCRDFARFGYLYLRQGQWNTDKLISDKLVATAVGTPLPPDLPRTRGIPSQMLSEQRSFGGDDNQEDHRGSYSFMWWVNGRDLNGNLFWPEAPEDTFAAIGYGGARSLVVIPSLDIIACWMGNQTPIIPEIISKDGRWYMNEAIRMVVESTKPRTKEIFVREPEVLSYSRHIVDASDQLLKSAKMDLGVNGLMPNCTTDQSGLLHVVFVANEQISYLTVGEKGREISVARPIPGSINGLRPWVYVSPDNMVHVVWDNWINVFYSALIDGQWQPPVPVPKGRYKRNFCGQIVGSDNALYISSCAITKYKGGSSMVYRVTENGISLITSYGSSLYYPPALSFSPTESKDEKPVYAAVGGGYINYVEITGKNVIYKNNPILNIVHGRFNEGLTAFNVDGDLGIVSSWYNNKLDRGFWANTTARSRSGRGGVFLGWGEGYPRSAYDDSSASLYVLFQKENRPWVVVWNPKDDIVKGLGKVTDEPISLGAPNWRVRGAGSGGIAQIKERKGIHLIVSINGRLYYLTVE